MFLGGPWWLPTFNGEPSFENPPLYFWLVALSYKAFGVSTFAAQFPSACMGVAAVLATFLLGNRLFGSPAGLYAGVILTTSLPFAKYARHAMVDVTLSFFVCLALLALWEAVHRDKRWFLLWGLACGAAVLTKSVLGLFPALIAVVWLMATGRPRELLRLPFLCGTSLAVVVGGSWYLVESLAFGEAFLQKHFGWLILKRGFGSSGGPWWGHLDYLRDLVSFYWPWLPLLGWVLFRSFRTGAHRKPEVRLVLIWAGAIFLVMSLMDKRSLWYVLPAYPALALLIGGSWMSFPRGWNQRAQAWVLAVGTLCALVVVLLPIRLDREREASVRELAPLVRKAAGEGVLLYCFRGDYHGLNNALLFYSDHAVPKANFLKEAAQVREAFRGKGSALCLVGRKDLVPLTKDLGPWYLWKEAEDLVLIADRDQKEGGER
jgi:4-amino-4-deoxy-L-arabinose transferase-like glycosyltransferase